MPHARQRARFAASLLIVGTASAVATLLLATGGDALGSSSAAQYEYGHPTSQTLPAISGTAQVGQKLTTSNGTWSSSSSITLYGYGWFRCDSAGGKCGAIAGATANSYTLTADDQGHTIRSGVTAVNANGPTSATSPQTAVVVAAYPTGKQVDAKQVTLPNRLIVDTVKYSANPIRSRTTPTTMQVRIEDSHQNAVQNALVFVQGLPYSRVAPMQEVRTDANGWATVQLQAGQFFPRKGYVVLFVRARVEGQDLIAGTSTRRLVQVTVNR
jgi:fibronectin type 3 domain-containing protein